MTNKNPQKIARREAYKNPYETRDDFVSKVKQTAKDEISEDWKVAMTQMLGLEKDKAEKASHEASGELREGEELVLIEKSINIEPGIDYRGEIIHAETRIRNQDNKELRDRMDELRIEIAKLSKSSRELQTVAKDINMDTLTEAPGKLHVNFFEWVILQLKVARIRVENSVSWFNAVSGKKNKKDYWS
ncbi:MAG TPA: DUF5660 family protein, partial [Candidatus Sulfotelmatobacter sp.]|nr:DUF5660 family protein [Candidatus Sulfotelmatobacter sp.]